MNWYIKALKNYATFDGRAQRAEYWYFALFNLLVSFGLGFVEGFLGVPGVISGVYALAVLVPGVAVGVRRLHDINKSGWMLFVALIPIVGAIILLVWAVQDSDSGDNDYGPNPKGAAAG